MTQHSDIHLETNRTRVVSDVDVSTAKNDPPTVAIDPSRPSLRVGGDDAEDGGAIRVRDASGSKTLGSLRNPGFGALSLSNQADDRSIDLDPSVTPVDPSQLAINFNESPTVKIEDREGSDGTRHRLSLFETVGNGVLAEANDLGQVRLDHSEGKTTCELDGERSALLLPGVPEFESNRQIDGGGELLLRTTSPRAEVVEPANPDITVHAKAIWESKYGVRNDNRPRVYIDGPEATLELGREKTTTGHPPVNGAIELRTDAGHSVLEARVAENHESEFVFKQVVDGTPRHRGQVRSRSNGIAIFDAGGNEALRITDSGEIKTRKEITTNATL